MGKKAWLIRLGLGLVVTSTLTVQFGYVRSHLPPFDLLYVTEEIIAVNNSNNAEGKVGRRVDASKQVKSRPPLPVFCLPVSQSCNNRTFLQSTKLVHTDNPHLDRVTWWVATGNSLTNELIPLANNSMQLRSQWDTKNNREKRTTSIGNLDSPEWNIILWDSTDLGGGGWFEWFAETNLVPITGWQRLHFVVRTDTIKPRRMKPLFNLPQNTSFVGFTGQQRNYSQSVLKKAFRTVTHYFYPVRDDLYEAIESQLKRLSKSRNTEVDIYKLPRTVDAAHFWNPNVTSNNSFLRARVSQALQEVASESNSLSVFTDIAGHRAVKGRNLVHNDYVEKLLDAKIIVVCQRDGWPDHWRLFEAMISGALVMSDPMLVYPHGLVDGESIIIYQSIEDLKANIEYYLAHPDQRLDIARRGREISLAQHRMVHRWEQLLLVDDRSAYVNDFGVTHMI